MSLSAPRQIFGIQGAAFFSRTDGTAYGLLRNLGSSSLSIQGSLVESYGGSNIYAWAAEDGNCKAEMQLKPRQLEDFMFTLFFGKAPTAVTSADTAGTISTLTNLNGTSCKVATTGIASVQIKASTGAADLKFGKYLIVVASATTVNVYVSTDIDFGVKTTSLTFQTDLLKITATALTVTTAAATTDIPATGVQIVGGSGTIGMTTGDTAYFYVLPPSSKSMSVVIGSTTNRRPEFNAMLYSSRRSNNELIEIEIYRAKGSPFNLPMDEFKWSEYDVKAMLMYDATADGILAIRHISET